MCCHLGASLQKQLSAQTSPVQPDSLMVHLIKQQQKKRLESHMAEGHFHNIQKKSADDQFSISSESPDCKIDEDASVTESKRK